MTLIKRFEIPHDTILLIRYAQYPLRRSSVGPYYFVQDMMKQMSATGK